MKEKIAKTLGPLEEIYLDPSVHEIIVDSPDDIYYEKNGKILNLEKSFKSKEELEDTIRNIFKIAERDKLDQPHANCRLPDGTRFNAVFPEISLNGPAFNLMKMFEQTMTWDDIVKYDAISQEGRELVEKLVHQGKDILLGSTANAGRNTFLNLLISSIQKNWRVVVVEKTATTNIDNRKRTVMLETPNNDPSEMKMLIKAVETMRADYIVVNELLGSETVDCLNLSREGHSLISLISAENTLDALKRVELKLLSAQIGLGLTEIRSIVSSAFEIIIHLGHGQDGKRKVSEICQVGCDDLGNYKITPMYRYNKETNKDELLDAGREYMTKK